MTDLLQSRPGGPQASAGTDAAHKGNDMIENPGDYDDDPEEGLAPLIRPRQEPVPDSYLVRLNVDTEQLTETQNIAHPDPQAMNRRIWAAI